MKIDANSRGEINTTPAKMVTSTQGILEFLKDDVNDAKEGAKSAHHFGASSREQRVQELDDVSGSEGPNPGVSQKAIEMKVGSSVGINWV
jgi:hypothetical protein